ncbi:MAG: hypothetical protein HRO68_06745 [Nitrosopumilus sp.]|nr:hypothetical protein [Nitrosopumilus sp.]
MKVKVTPAEAGIGIAWKVMSGDGKFKSWTTTTDARGIAEAEYVLGPNAGSPTGSSNTIKATLMQGTTTGSTHIAPSVTFTATSQNPTITIENNNQRVSFGSAIEKPLIVIVKDPNGVPIEGTKVTFEHHRTSQTPNSPDPTPYPDRVSQKVGGVFTDHEGKARAIVGFDDHNPGNYTFKAKLPEFGTSEVDFRTIVTPIGSLFAAKNNFTKISGETIQLKLTSTTCPGTVSWAKLTADGVLSHTSTTVTQPTCETQVDYTFGPDRFPDIVSATLGSTIYFDITHPNVEVLDIKFLGNVDLRYDATNDIPNQPEWRKHYDAQDVNHPIAYVKDTSGQNSLGVVVRADVEIQSADINAVVLDGNALQEVVTSTIQFGPGLFSQIISFNGQTASDVSKKDVTWLWKVSNMNDLGSQPKNSISSGSHTVYTLLQNPQDPMSEPRTKVLDHSTSSSWQEVLHPQHKQQQKL